MIGNSIASRPNRIVLPIGLPTIPDLTEANRCLFSIQGDQHRSIPREKSATTNSRPLKHCWPTRCVAGRFFFTIHLLLWIAIGSTERCLSEMECCYTRCLPRIPVASVGSFSVTFTAPCAVSRIAYCTQVPVVLRCTFPTCHGTIKHSHSAIQSPLQITYPLASLGHW